MDRRVDLAVALAVMVLGALVVMGAQNISLGTVRDPVGSRGLPTFLGLFFVVGGAVLAVRRVLHWREAGPVLAAEGQGDDQPGEPASASRAVAMALVTVGWTLLLPVAGYILVTVVSVILFLRLMGFEVWPRGVAIAVGYTIVTYFLFAVGLSVRLAPGILRGPLDALGLPVT